MLFEADRHEPLVDVEWDAGRAHDALRAIVADMEAALGDRTVWPAHPLDEVRDSRAGEQSVYLGAAGALWAL